MINEIPQRQAGVIFSRLERWGFIDEYYVRDGSHYTWMRDDYDFESLGCRVDRLLTLLSVYFYGDPKEMPAERPVGLEPIEDLVYWAVILIKVYDTSYPGFCDYWDDCILKNKGHLDSDERLKLVKRYQTKFGFVGDDVNRDQWLPSEIKISRRC